jgi:hypothetical protein
MYGLACSPDDWSQLHYKVRVRPTAPPLPTQCLWGSAGLTQNMTFDTPLILHIRNDLFGEPVTIGTQVVAAAPQSSPIQTIMGTILPGECVSISIQGCSGVFATCPVESTVYCLIKASG